MERLNKLDKIQKILCSEVLGGYISTNLYDLFDENSLMIIDKTNCEVGDSSSIF